VVGDSARGEISRGTWETQRGAGMVGNMSGEDITCLWLRWESEGGIVAKKRGNSRGAKAPYCRHVCVRRGASRLEGPTTEEEVVSRSKLPLSLSSPRHKLGQKAKQEPKFLSWRVCMPVARVHRKAGCGKPACPV